jgi:hypothetical protein
MTRPGPCASARASTPAKFGSGFITIPPPRRRAARRSPGASPRRTAAGRALDRESPASCARARMLKDRGPSNMPGNSVRTSIRKVTTPRGGKPRSPARTSTDRTNASTTGRYASSPSRGRPASRGPAPADAGHLAQRLPRVVHDGAPHGIGPVELVCREFGEVVAPHRHAGAGELPRGLGGRDPFNEKTAQPPARCASTTSYSRPPGPPAGAPDSTPSGARGTPPGSPEYIAPAPCRVRRAGGDSPDFEKFLPALSMELPRRTLYPAVAVFDSWNFFHVPLFFSRLFTVFRGHRALREPLERHRIVDHDLRRVLAGGVRPHVRDATPVRASASPRPRRGNGIFLRPSATTGSSPP